MARAKDLWEEFLWRYPDGTAGHCGLCGNSGVIDTMGRARTAAGLAVGVRRYCICPNGRAILRGTDGQLNISEVNPDTPRSLRDSFPKRGW